MGYWSSLQRVTALLLIVFPLASFGQILSWGFNDGTITSANRGSLGENYNLIIRADGGSANDYHTASGLGVSGLPADRALDLGQTTLSMGGDGGYASLASEAHGDLAPLSQLTLTGWYRVANGTDLVGSTLIRNNGGNAGWGLISTTAGRLQFRIGDGSSEVAVNSNTNAYTSNSGEWTFFALSWDGSNVNWYTGDRTTPVSSAGSSPFSHSMVLDAQAFTLGKSNSNSGTFDGLLDSIRVYDTALSQLEIEDIRNDVTSEPISDLYLNIIDRVADAEWSRFASNIQDSIDAQTAPSRWDLFFFSAIAYRAGLADITVGQKESYYNAAELALDAYVQAISHDLEAMANQLLFCLDTVCRIYELLDEAGRLDGTEQSEALSAIKNGAIATYNAHGAHRGAFNRAFHLAVGLAYAADLLPSEPEAATWNTYAQNVWSDFTTPQDTFEDSSGYNGLWSYGVMHLSSLLGTTPEINSTHYESIWERMSAWHSPIGILPEFGNTGYHTHGMPQWIDAWERLGSFYQNREFQDNAMLIALAIEDQPNRTDFEIEPIALAHKALSARFSETSIHPESEITYRQTDWGESVPDKLILRNTSSNGAPLFLCVDLHDHGYHGHADGGAISLLTVGENVAIRELGRPEIEALDHYTAWGAPSESLFLDREHIFPSATPIDWIISHKWPGTYAGSYTPDLSSIDYFFLRLRDVPALGDQQVSIVCDGVWGVLPDGSEDFIAGPFSGSIQLTSSSDNDSAFVESARGINADLRSYDYLRVRFATDDSRSIDFFGHLAPAINGNSPTDVASLRTRSSQPVIDAWVKSGPKAGFRRLMTDAIGRIIWHTREHHLSEDGLFFSDTFEITQDGAYVLGPIFHSENPISGSIDSNFITSSVIQSDIILGEQELRWISTSETPLKYLENHWVVANGQNYHAAACFSGDLNAGDTITIHSGLIWNDSSHYDSWSLVWSQGNSAPSMIAPSADPNHDGIPNTGHFLGGTNPFAETANSTSAFELGDRAQTFSLRHNKVASYLNPIIELSYDLVQWNEVSTLGSDVTVTQDNDYFGFGLDRIQIEIEVENTDNAFIRRKSDTP